MGMYCGTVQNGSEIHTAQSGSATNLWMKTSHIVGIPCVFVYDLAMSIEFALTGIIQLFSIFPFIWYLLVRYCPTANRLVMVSHIPLF